MGGNRAIDDDDIADVEAALKIWNMWKSMKGWRSLRGLIIGGE